MSESVVSEIAKHIFEKTILHNVFFYLIFLFISIAGAAIFSFIKGLSQKKGELFATKTDLNNLIDQIKNTTKIQEEIKTSISHMDWSNREWKKIRIIKLEEFIKSLNEYQIKALKHQKILFSHDLELKKNAIMNPPIWSELYIPTLYFPELIEPASELNNIMNDSIKQSVIFSTSNNADTLENTIKNLNRNNAKETVIINDIIKKSQLIMTNFSKQDSDKND